MLTHAGAREKEPEAKRTGDSAATYIAGKGE
jgi:hypothetical protein